GVWARGVEGPFGRLALRSPAATACGAAEALGVAGVFAAALAFTAVDLVAAVFVGFLAAVAFGGAGLAFFGSESVVPPLGRSRVVVVVATRSIPPFAGPHGRRVARLV